MGQEDKAATAGLGFLSGLVASLCCLGPVAIILLGLGPIFGISGLCFKTYRPLFFAIGAFVLVVGLYLWLRKKEGTCDFRAVHNNQRKILLALAAMAVTYYLLLAIVVPHLHQGVLGNASCAIAH